MGTDCIFRCDLSLCHSHVEDFQPYILHNVSYAVAKRGYVEKVIFLTLRELNKPVDFSKSTGFYRENS